MTPKVRRGLGLLALVPLLLIADWALYEAQSWMSDAGGPPDWLALIPLALAAVAAIGAVVAFVAGLALLALGLLRDNTTA